MPFPRLRGVMITVKEAGEVKPHSELTGFAKEANDRMAHDYHDGFFRMEESLKALVAETDVLPWLAAEELCKIADDP